MGSSILNIVEFSAPFTYTVNADNTVDISSGVETWATVLGGGTGNSGAVEFGPSSHRLQIGDGGKTLLGTPRTVIEEETVQTNLPVPLLPHHRICTRGATFVKI